MKSSVCTTNANVYGRFLALLVKPISALGFQIELGLRYTDIISHKGLLFEIQNQFPSELKKEEIFFC